MKRFFILLAFAISLGFAMPPVSTSLAQGSGEGLFNAIAYKALPENQTFRVQPLDNSDENMALKSEFERLLVSKGFSLSDEAVLIITFETRNELGAYKTRDKRALVELGARGGRKGGEDASMRLNLYDSSTGGVFNKGKGETSVMTRTQYRLDVSIDNRDDGKRHWQAWAVAKQDRSDSKSLIQAMIPEMIKHLGTTVKSRTFGLF